MTDVQGVVKEFRQPKFTNDPLHADRLAEDIGDGLLHER
jgi:hypothetical protein